MQTDKLWMLVDTHMAVGRDAMAWQENRPHIAGLYQNMMHLWLQTYIKNEVQTRQTEPT